MERRIGKRLPEAAGKTLSLFDSRINALKFNGKWCENASGKDRDGLGKAGP
jgi:hypothetical protein